MKLPIRILVTDLTTLPTGVTWGDIITNWEAYAIEWQQDNALPTIQSELPVLDMFEDESITLKRIVKDLNDPKKLFTDYSKSFTIPASKKNNVIFKHYYKLEIDNGIDARELIPCKVLINNEVFKVGNLQLESVNMQDGKAYSYNVRFLGKLTELQKQIGKTKLASLPLGTVYSFDQKTEFNSVTLDDLVFPLSSKRNRFLWAATENAYVDTPNTKNIKYISTSTTHAATGDYAIANEDLTGAYKVGTLISKIESEFGLSFNGVMDNNYITELYMWLTSDALADTTGSYNAETSNLSPTSSSFTGVFINSGQMNVAYAPETYYISARGTFGGSTTLSLIKDGAAVATTTTSGSYTTEIAVNSYSNFSIRVDSDTVDASLPVELKIRNGGGTSESFTETLVLNSVGNYYVKDYVPDVTVMDFLSELFRMFNIVAIVNDDLTIDTYHYDGFMGLGSAKDISNYVNVDYTISAPNYYSGVDFKYQYKETAIEQGYLSTNGRHYGQLTYEATSANSNFVNGQTYQLEMKSCLVPVEHITDGATLLYTTHTYFGDVSLNKKDVGLAFTYVEKDSNQALAYYDGTSVSSVNTYLMPTAFHGAYVNDPALVNSFECGLFFGDEQRTVYPSTRSIGLGLQNVFYRGVISQLFDADKRRMSVQAILPLGFIKDLYLGDILQIRGNYYTLNSIETDFMTGISKLDMTQTGTSKNINFRTNTASITNASGASSYITYLDTSGNITTSTVADATSVDIDMIGLLIHSSENLTVTYAEA